MKLNKNLLIIGLVSLLIGGGVGFFGGMQYQKGQAASQRSQFAGNFGNGANGTGRRFGGNGANGMAVRGQIISSDSNSITIKMNDGSTKIVVLGSSTTIAKTTTGSSNDLTNGANVIIFGTTNSDGSVTAQNIQIGNAPFGPRASATPIPL